MSRHGVRQSTDDKGGAAVTPDVLWRKGILRTSCNATPSSIALGRSCYRGFTDGAVQFVELEAFAVAARNKPERRSRHVLSRTSTRRAGAYSAGTGRARASRARASRVRASRARASRARASRAATHRGRAGHARIGAIDARTRDHARRLGRSRRSARRSHGAMVFVIAPERHQRRANSQTCLDFSHDILRRSHCLAVLVSRARAILAPAFLLIEASAWSTSDSGSGWDVGGLRFSSFGSGHGDAGEQPACRSSAARRV
jgi:hypothetical protein